MQWKREEVMLDSERKLICTRKILFGRVVAKKQYIDDRETCSHRTARVEGGTSRSGVTSGDAAAVECKVTSDFCTHAAGNVESDFAPFILLALVVGFGFTGQ